MDTKQAASVLSTEPKTLRRFLRADSHYANAGAGGRYVFSDDDMPEMRKRFENWLGEKASKPSTPRAPRVKEPADDTEAIARQRISTKVLGRRMYASERTKRDAISRARVDRLEAALIAKGLHISQMKVTR